MLEYYFMILIYVGCIVYGIVDNLVGAIWPTYANIVDMSIASYGVLSILASISATIACGNAYKFRKKLGNNYSIALGMLFIAIGVIIYALAYCPWIICVGVLIAGFGLGIVDAISNNYAVKYYTAREVSHLQAFVGLGATVGPIVMSYSLSSTNDVDRGFYIIFAFTMVLIIVLFVTKIFWEKKKTILLKEVVEKYTISEVEKNDKTNLIDAFKLENAKFFAFILLIGFCANGIMNAWIATILTVERNVTAVEGAMAVSVFFFFATATRVVIGFLSHYMVTSHIIRISLVVSILATILLCVPLMNKSIIYLTVALMGIGIAPFSPFITYNMKEIFGEKNLAVLISLLSVCHLVGNLISHLLAGLAIEFIGAGAISYVLLVCLIVTLISYTYLIKKNTKS